MSDALDTLTNMARQLLGADPSVVHDRAGIERAIATVAPVVEGVTGVSFSADDRIKVLRALESVFVVEQGEALVLRDRRLPPEWYIGERRKPGPFMRRYLQKLEEGGWPQRSVNELRDSSARVLEVLDDPDRDGPWDWRGLVVGDVQSGKTAHYTGLINRAADAGYRVIVVLAGMHNVLRLQTQQRLEGDFLGWDTSQAAAAQHGGRKAIGVGLIPPQLIVDSLTTADPSGDFNLAVARQANFAPSTQPCLLVVKKNATILRNLNRWIARLPAASRGAPLLVIDDECDQASVDTGDQPLLPDGTFDEDYDPKTINGEIRKLLNAFSRSGYVGYTATPFANILSHDERTADGYGEDLFPATFIVALSAPDDYFGPTAVFGADDESEPGLPLVRSLEQSQENWIPDRHDKNLKPTYQGEDRIPPSLERAIEAFVVTCTARAARGQDRVHNSMLVHVSRFVDVHDVVAAQVQRYLDTLRAFISGGDEATLQRLKALWDSDYAPTYRAVAETVFGRATAPVAWGDVLARLSECSDRVRVIITNGRTLSGIDYESYRDTGLSVIAVGGDKLSRGLTLEGLSVSYFLRISRQYDSLLQMGRWFGYRRGFADLCRLYTTTDMQAWFRHVATANKNLRAQIARMQLMLKTPKEYGLRVASHPIMQITAANKRRHAAPVQLTFASEGKIQTVLLKDELVVKRNAEATEAFLNELRNGVDDPVRPSGGVAKGVLWHQVGGQEVAAYLKSLSYAPEVIDIDGDTLSDYILRQLNEGELVDWTVFLATGAASPFRFAGRDIKCVERNPLSDDPAETRFIVKSILNRPDEAIDLDAEQYATALRRTNEVRALEGDGQTDRPSGPAIRETRSKRNGLLIIYPMDPAAARTTKDCPLVGFVASFPGSDTAVDESYLENTVAQRGTT